MDEILTKYHCHAETGNYFSKMSSQSLAERIMALKGQAFSNTNTESGNRSQTNYDEEFTIRTDSSNKTPPSGLCKLTNGYGTDDGILSARESSTQCCNDKPNDNEGPLRLDNSKQIKPNPVVIITPAVMEESNTEEVIKIVNRNGELPSAMLKDAIETCSLSSVGSCSENEILTDDEPSDDELYKQSSEEKSEKVKINFLFIRAFVFS